MLAVIDIGTSHLKLAVFHECHCVDTIERKNVTYQPNPGSQEQNPVQILADVKGMFYEANKKWSIIKILFSSQMHSFILTTATGEVIQPSLIWSDQRASKLGVQFQQSALADKIYHQTGTPIHAMSPFIKAYYYKQKEPKQFGNPNLRMMGIKTYLIWQLTGEFVIDIPTASTSGMMNLQTKNWDKTILSLLGMTPNQLPKIVSSLMPLQMVEIGSHNRQVLIYPGSTDGALANYSYEALTTKQLLLSFGTSGAIRYLSEKPHLSSTNDLFCYLVADNGPYLIGGALNNMGNILANTYQNPDVNQTMSFEDMLSVMVASNFPPNHFIYLPYQYGERAPFWNSELTVQCIGNWHNASSHDKLQAIFAGIFYQVRLLLDKIHEQFFHNGGRPLLVNGKIFQHPTVCQKVATILNYPIQPLTMGDASLIGGYRLLTHQEIPVSQADRVFYPVKEQVDVYTQQYRQFKQNAYHQDRRVKDKLTMESSDK